MKKQRLYYGWIVVSICLIIGTVAYGIRYSYGVFFKPLEQDFGWNRALTSGVFSFYLVLAAVFAILGGWALDRYGPRIVAILMGLFTGLSLLLTSQVSSLWQIAVSYSLLLAIGTGPTYVVTMATASRWFIKKRGIALAIAGAGAGLGIMVMTPVAAYLIAGYGWRTAYVVMAVVALLTIVPGALLLRKVPTVVTASPNQGEKSSAFRRAEEIPRNGPEDFSLRQAARTKNFWLVFFVWLLYSLCLHLVLTHLVPHATDLGISPVEAATVLIWLGGSSILGRLLMGRLSDSIGKKQTASFSALMMGGSMLLLAGASDLWLLSLFGIIFGFFYGGLDPPLAAIIGDVFGMRNIGVIMGVLVIGWGTGAAIGPALAGYLFDNTGNYFSAFLVGMVTTLIAAILIFLVKQPAPPAPH